MLHNNTQKKSQIRPINITDVDFADDTISDTAAQAQELLHNVEHSAPDVGFHMNAMNTQYKAYNQPTCVEIHTADGSCLEEVKDFKYLGSWVRSTEQDSKARKAMTWKACSKLKKIHPLQKPQNKSTVESVRPGLLLQR